jgi:poly(A) polymerase Pap1
MKFTFLGVHIDLLFASVPLQELEEGFDIHDDRVLSGMVSVTIYRHTRKKRKTNKK